MQHSIWIIPLRIAPAMLARLGDRELRISTPCASSTPLHVGQQDQPA
jgi:hypothetical protein